MEHKLTSINVEKLKTRLQLVQLKSLLAIVVGDCRAVARLTCEAARLRDAIDLAGVVELQAC